MSPYFNIVDGGGSRFKDANIVYILLETPLRFPSSLFSFVLIKGWETTAEMLN